MSEDVFTLCDTFVDERAALSPIDATYCGIPGFEDRWDDLSTEGSEAYRDLILDQRRRLAALDPAETADAGLAVRVADAFMADELAWFETDEHLRNLDTLASPLQDLRQLFDHMDRASAEGWQQVLARLRGLPAAAEGYSSRLEDGRQRGLSVARRQVLEGVRQAGAHAAEDSSLYDLARELEQLEIGDDALRAAVAEAVEGARAAFGMLAGYLESEYLPSALPGDAVGEERYVHLARRFLGDAIDPHATYAWGWAEVARLRAAMEEVGAEILRGAPLSGVLELLQTDSGRAAASPDGFRALMAERLESAVAALDGTHFDVPAPIRTVDVKLAPPGGPLGAYYVAPSEDFKRAGSVWWSLGGAQMIPLFDQISTAYHEGFPGHHLQAGIQMASTARLSRLQKLMIWYPGSGEGWALYAEDVMEELGFLDRPDYLMGKLASEMLRACRVVIDIGCHLRLPIPGDQPFHPGEEWTFEAGVEMLTDYAAQGSDLAVSEMNRYLGWPGQAIAYKVGQQAIRDMRSEAEQRHGAGFDRKAFHARLLEIGSVGLDVTREHMAGF